MNNIYESPFLRSKIKKIARGYRIANKTFEIDAPWKKDDAVVNKNRKCKNNRNTMGKYVLCSIVGGENRLPAEQHHLKTNMKKCIKSGGHERCNISHSCFMYQITFV